MKARIILLVSLLISVPSLTSAHCDTLDGPVASAARKSIETKNPNYFLVWVKEKDEVEILGEFKKTLDERAANPEKSDAIDMAFLENLVKIHREGEGAEYTGLKPAGTVSDPAILMVDKGIESGNSLQIETFLSDTLRKETSERFREVVGKKDYAPENVPAGREYVESYVGFMHWAEGMYGKITAKESAHAHSSE